MQMPKESYSQIKQVVYWEDNWEVKNNEGKVNGALQDKVWKPGRLQLKNDGVDAAYGKQQTKLWDPGKMKIEDTWSGDNVFFLLWESDAGALATKGMCQCLVKPKGLDIRPRGLIVISMYKNTLFPSKELIGMYPGYFLIKEHLRRHQAMHLNSEMKGWLEGVSCWFSVSSWMSHRWIECNFLRIEVVAVI